MPKYLVMKAKYSNFSKEQIIQKFGLTEFKTIANQRLKRLKLFQEIDSIQYNLLATEKETNLEKVDLLYYSNMNIGDFSFDNKTQYIVIPKLIAKNSDYAVNLTGISVENIRKKNNTIGFCLKANEYENNDLVLIRDKSSFDYSVIKFSDFMGLYHVLISKVIDVIYIPEINLVNKEPSLQMKLPLELI